MHTSTRTHTCRSRLYAAGRAPKCMQQTFTQLHRALRTLPFAFGTCDRSNRQAFARVRVRIRVAVTLDSVVVPAAASVVVVSAVIVVFRHVQTVRCAFIVPSSACLAAPCRAVALKLRKSPMAGAFNFWHTPLNVHFNNADVVGHFTLGNFYCLPPPQAVSPPLSPVIHLHCSAAPGAAICSTVCRFVYCFPLLLPQTLDLTLFNSLFS